MDREKYAIWIAFAPEGEIYEEARRLFPLELQKGFCRVATSLVDAQRMLLMLRQSGGNGLVFPARYSVARVSREEALQRATEEYRRITGSTDEFGPLGVAEDEGGWWAFLVENLSAQERGMIPGTRTIAIDKVAGSVVTSEQMDRILRLSVLRVE